MPSVSAIGPYSTPVKNLPAYCRNKIDSGPGPTNSTAHCTYSHTTVHSVFEKGENAVHGSDSDENAEIEGNFHFGGTEQF